MPSFEPVTLKLWDPDGNQHDVPLPGPGGTIRVVVGEPGKQSGVWRIWANKKTFDVYVAVRAIAGTQKWSLHETGDWRYQFINDEKAAKFSDRDSRIIDQWDKPAEVGETGWTRGLAIRVRHQDLVEVTKPEEVPADTLWIPPPPEGHMVGLHIVIARPNQQVVELSNVEPVAGFALVGEQVLLLLKSVDPVSEANNETIRKALAQMFRMVRARGVDLASAVALRAAVGGNNTDGERLVWDVAVPGPYT